MAKSKETFNKKDKEQRRMKQKKEKQEKKEERKNNSKKGKSLDEMMAYVDDEGNITDTPPDPRNRKVFKVEDIQIKVPEGGNERDFTRTGTVHFFDEEKGFGFILDSKSQERIFVHSSNLMEPVKAADKVIFEVEAGNRGPSAVNVKKANGK
jgi:cold shock CspA family protein